MVKKFRILRRTRVAIRHGVQRRRRDDGGERRPGGDESLLTDEHARAAAAGGGFSSAVGVCPSPRPTAPPRSSPLPSLPLGVAKYSSASGGGGARVSILPPPPTIRLGQYSEYFCNVFFPKVIIFILSIFLLYSDNTFESIPNTQFKILLQY